MTSEATFFLSDVVTVMCQLLLACSVIAYLLQTWWSRRWTINDGQLPPGSMGYFAVGESLQLMANMHNFFMERDEQHGNIYKTHIIGSPTVRVAGAEYLKQIFCGDSNTIDESHNKNIMELLGPRSLTATRGRVHKDLRFQIMNAFKRDNLQHHIPRIYTIMERHIQEWCAEDKILGFKRVKELSFEAAWDVIVGLPLKKEEVKDVVEQFEIFVSGMISAPFNIPGFPYYKALKAKAVIHCYIEKAIGLGDSLSPSSVLATMLQLKRNSGVEYSTEQIREVATELLFGGHDTVSSVATSLMFCFSQHYDVQRKLIREMMENELLDKNSTITFDCITKMSYLNDVIKEVLRMYPPVPFGTRTAKRSFKLGNYTVPEGWLILANIYYTLKQADVEQRDVFKPERWHDTDQSVTDFNYIPFGAGPRNCVGREYAKIFLRVFVICLLQRCDVEVLSEKVEMICDPILRPKDYLPARFIHRDINLDKINAS